jgi:hypothetical protein
VPSDTGRDQSEDHGGEPDEQHDTAVEDDAVGMRIDATRQAHKCARCEHDPEHEAHADAHQDRRREREHPGRHELAPRPTERSQRAVLSATTATAATMRNARAIVSSPSRVEPSSANFDRPPSPGATDSKRFFVAADSSLPVASFASTCR